LHDNALALHEYTHDQRKKAHNGQGDGFDGELDNFQEPELSSLVKLVSLLWVWVAEHRLIAMFIEYG
jgi:hypothetical protein